MHGHPSMILPRDFLYGPDLWSHVRMIEGIQVRRAVTTLSESVPVREQSFSLPLHVLPVFPPVQSSLPPARPAAASSAGEISGQSGRAAGSVSPRYSPRCPR